MNKNAENVKGFIILYLSFIILLINFKLINIYSNRIVDSINLNIYLKNTIWIVKNTALSKLFISKSLI